MIADISGSQLWGLSFIKVLTDLFKKLYPPLITNLSTRFYLKDSAIERCSFYRTQAQLRIYKTILRSIIYLNLNRMSNISLSKLRSAKEKCLMTGFHKTLTLGGVNNTDFLSLKLLLLYSSL